MTLTADDVRKAREEAEKALTSAAEKMEDLEERWQEARREWYVTVLDAFNAGCTYEQISTMSKRSRIRIAEVLRQERKRRGQEPEE